MHKSVKLKELIHKSQYGVSIPESEFGSYRIIKMSNIEDGSLNISTLGKVDMDETDAKKFFIKKGDILFNRTNSIDLVGKSAIATSNIDCVFASYLVRFKCKQGNDPRFICYFLNLETTRKKIKSMATPAVQQYNVNPKALLNSLDINVPDTTQQIMISDFLDSITNRINSINRLISYKNIMLKYIMGKLLTGKQRLHGYSYQWTVQKLGDLFTERRENNCSNMQLLSITAEKGVVPQNNINKRDTSNSDKTRYLRIKKGDIGYNTMRMWQGVSALSQYDGIVSPAYTVCTPKSNICGEFMAHLFKLPSVIHMFYRYSQGLVDDTLNLKYKHFSEIKLKIPSDINEQRAIVSILNEARREIALLLQQKEAITLQKRGLMKQLLTGETQLT